MQCPVDVVEQAMLHDKPETILILAKAAKLSWITTKALLSFCIRQRRISSIEIERCLASFERLNFGYSSKNCRFLLKYVVPPDHPGPFSRAKWHSFPKVSQ